jgi:hypothetical protein
MFRARNDIRIAFFVGHGTQKKAYGIMSKQLIPAIISAWNREQEPGT